MPGRLGRNYQDVTDTIRHFMRQQHRIGDGLCIGIRELGVVGIRNEKLSPFVGERFDGRSFDEGGAFSTSDRRKRDRVAR